MDATQPLELLQALVGCLTEAPGTLGDRSQMQVFVAQNSIDLYTSKIFPETIAFTGQWPGYAVGCEDTFAVREIGATHYIEFAKAANGYSIGFSAASPQIVRQWQYKPQVIFANAFTAWTAIALLLKPLCGWQVIVTYEGGSSVYESPSSTIRDQARRQMARWADRGTRSGAVSLSDLAAAGL